MAMGSVCWWFLVRITDGMEGLPTVYVAMHVMCNLLRLLSRHVGRSIVCPVVSIG